MSLDLLNFNKIQMEKTERKSIKIVRNPKFEENDERETNNLDNRRLQYLLQKQFSVFASFPKFLKKFNEKIIEEKIYLKSIFREFPYSELIVYIVDNLNKKLEKVFYEGFDQMRDILFKTGKIGDSGVKEFFDELVQEFEKSKNEIMKTEEKNFSNNLDGYFRTVFDSKRGKEFFSDEILRKEKIEEKSNFEESLKEIRKLIGATSSSTGTTKEVKEQEQKFQLTEKKSLVDSIKAKIPKINSKLESESISTSFGTITGKNSQLLKFKTRIFNAGIYFPHFEQEKVEISLLVKGDLLLTKNLKDFSYISKELTMPRPKNFSTKTEYYLHPIGKLCKILKNPVICSLSFKHHSCREYLSNVKTYGENNIAAFIFNRRKNNLSIINNSALFPYGLKTISQHILRLGKNAIARKIEGGMIPIDVKHSIYKIKGRRSLVFITPVDKKIYFFADFVKSTGKKNKIKELYTLDDTNGKNGLKKGLFNSKIFFDVVVDFAIFVSAGFVILSSKGQIMVKTKTKMAEMNLKMIEVKKGAEYLKEPVLNRLVWQKIEVIDELRVIIVETFDPQEKKFIVITYRFDISEKKFHLKFLNFVEIEFGPLTTEMKKISFSVDGHNQLLAFTGNHYQMAKDPGEKYPINVKIFCFKKSGMSHMQDIPISINNPSNKPISKQTVNNMVWDSGRKFLFLCVSLDRYVYITLIKFLL